ncbi:MFS transporter [Streptomyces sp. NP160]|uniref:MFS transporter n=1 Tax=Streptomyces sp. NP160 TaxID=2586637 RepID=UPI0015D62FA5|nr:MFS transporter [Streptomyces sp. NP160]
MDETVRSPRDDSAERSFEGSVHNRGEDPIDAPVDDPVDDPGDGRGDDAGGITRSGLAGTRRTALARYVIAATLARTADGGAVVAIVLLVTTTGGPGWLGGLLAACLTAPHLAGPFIARPLDTARDGRKVISAACLGHGATLAAAVLLYPMVHPAVCALLLAASGLLGPLLTGGISSRLPAIAGPGQRDQRRAQGWDVATYGIGGTIGPSVVAAVTAWSSATTAALVLAAATVVAAALVMLLPADRVKPTSAATPQPAATLGLMLRHGPLRRTLYLTMAVSASVSVLPVTAVASTGALGVGHAAAGVLTSAYGIGGLAASGVLMVRPLAGDADRSTTVLAVAVAGGLVAVLVSGVFGVAVATYALAGALNSLFFAATLAARSEYAPVQARGQVFVWIGALKITAGSAGTATAGALVAASVALPLLIGVGLSSVAALASALERHGMHRRRSGTAAARATSAPARVQRRE